MSINTTPFLHLPQWTADEKPSFLAEMNPAYASIDAGFKAVDVDVQTAQTTAEAAQTTANSADSQSKTNAASIVTIQQSLTSLEADFTNSKYLELTKLEVTNVPSGVTYLNATIISNGYAGFIQFNFNVTEQVQYGTSFGTITNLPFIIKQINLMCDHSYSENSQVCAFYLNINANGDISIHNNLTPTNIPAFTTTLFATGAFPIFKMPTARSGLPDNCLFIK